jgi:hypothetical protein
MLKKNVKFHLNLTAIFQLSILNYFCEIRGSQREAAGDWSVGSTPCRWASSCRRFEGSYIKILVSFEKSATTGPTIRRHFPEDSKTVDRGQQGDRRVVRFS